MANPVKTWNLQTADAKPYTMAVMPNGSLWIQFGAGTPQQLDAPSLVSAVADIAATIAQIEAANAACPFSKALESPAYTLHCDLANGHSSRFHHDPATGLYYLPDS